MTNLAIALKYAASGLAVFPLHSIADGRCSCRSGGCTSPGKHPRTQHGCTDATTDVDSIEKWWGQWPNANIGIATGRASGIVVIDIDGEEGEDSFAALVDSLGDLPQSWESLTGGGGRHLIFRYPPNAVIQNKVGLAPHVDIRGDGGYIVAPPSNHASGRAYAWEVSGDPDDAPLADLPPEWVSVLAASGPRFTPAAEVPAVLPAGGRNDGLFRLGASMRQKGLSADAIEAALQAENKSRCNPPLSPSEVRQIAESAARYERGVVPAVAPLPPVDGSEVLQKAQELITTGGEDAFYSDELMSYIVALEEAGAGADAAKLNQILTAQKGFKVREFKRAKVAYKKRLLGIEVVGEDGAELLPLSSLLPEYEQLAAFRMPAGWQIADGRCIFRPRVTPKDEVIREIACPHLIFPAARLKNIETGSERLRLIFHRDGMWQEVVVDKSTVATRQGISFLADAGIQVTSESAKLLIQFLFDFETANAATMPLEQSISRAGWLNLGQFAPYSDAVVYDGDLAFRGAHAAIKTAGDFDLWRKTVAAARQSMQLRAMLAASFAAPLLWVLDGQSFFVHLWGTRSGIGKTVALKTALSVWGNPSRLWRSFNATSVGLEMIAGFFHSLPVGIDEMQTMGGNLRDKIGGGARKLIYDLTQGQGRARGKKGGGIEVPWEWQTIFLTTGEQPLTEENNTEGALARVIELFLSEGDYPDDLPPEILAPIVNENYGAAGRAYIESLIAWLDGSRQPLIDLYGDIMEALRDREYSSKNIAAAAMLALGDCLSARFIDGVAADDSFGSAVFFGMELISRLQKKSQTDPAAQVRDWTQGWVASNIAHFDDSTNVQPRFGALQPNTANPEVYVICNVFNSALREAGFSPRAAVRALADAGDITPGENGQPSQIKYLSQKTTNVRCYVVKLAVDAENA